MERTQARLSKLLDFIAEGNASETVAAAVRDLEHQLKADNRAAAEPDAVAREPVKLPSVDEVLARSEPA